MSRKGRDPLAVLARLRNAEVMEARRRLMESAIAREEAAAREAAAERALQEEAMSGHPAFAAWLPRGLAARDATAAEHRLAEARSAEAASALGVARAAERAVEKLAELRAAEAERARRRAEQRALDEAGARGFSPR
ncbi:hypothetical protein [Muricoccus pecuniae]|uniref:Flagellar FliJ protein n=1 Tax=Muricoccus pecuniae TaxID=693023 RepID=A0A840Y0K6_9PROT|nr:hypothetical protein [Roseomonas pecuniae]MBB5693120.1 hypothetical protein [Roseomonas pecuniae]